MGADVMRHKISEVVNYFKACFFLFFFRPREGELMHEWRCQLFLSLSLGSRKKMSLFPRSRKKSLTCEKRKKIWKNLRVSDQVDSWGLCDNHNQRWLLNRSSCYWWKRSKKRVLFNRGYFQSYFMEYAFLYISEFLPSHCPKSKY